MGKFEHTFDSLKGIKHYVLSQHLVSKSPPP